jgi:hypothetical protein
LSDFHLYGGGGLCFNFITIIMTCDSKLCPKWDLHLYSDVGR